MPNILDIDAETLQTMTAQELRDAIGSYLVTKTKRDIICFLLDVEVIQDEPICVYGDDGQIIEKVSFESDVETGDVLKHTVTNWGYYPDGSIDTITISEFDQNNTVVATKKIKHYLDGRQPEEVE